MEVKSLVCLRSYRDRTSRQDFTDATIKRGRAGPLTGIPERDFLEPNAIAIRRGTDVKVPGNNNDSIETEVPVLRSRGSAPGREARDRRELHEILTQWKVTDEDRRQVISP